MKRLYYILPICLLTLFVYSCQRHVGEPLNLKQSFYPNEVGKWIEYDVTEIQHETQSDTFRYQIREVITSDFIDDEGRVAQRIERFVRADSTEAWAIKDVWSSVRTSVRAEKIEEDVRYIKMTFPIQYFESWNGNAFNNLNEWTYFYEEIDEPKTINGFTFDSTVVVNQRDNFNFVEYENAYEVYAKNVGMVYKQFIDLSIDNFDILDIQQGKELEMTVIGYGNN